MTSQIEDQLSWEEFYKVSKKRPKSFKKITEFNRLIAHSKNFFVISGYGAFTPGYLLIISKDFLPSFGLIEENKTEELYFLVALLKKVIFQNFKRLSVVFEHGMCACIGGLDRAHIHVMSIPKNSTEKTIKDSIDLTLYSRKAGINYIEYNNYKLENIHDINQIFEDIKKEKNKLKDIKISGKILKIKDIKNLSPNKWPLITLNHINKGGHYVYFKSDFDKASFLTTHNFQTQFGREVVFQNEIKLNNKFKKQIEKIKKNNQFLEVWRWQNCMFEENIIKTIKLSIKGFEDLEKKYSKDFFKFDIKILK